MELMHAVDKFYYEWILKSLRSMNKENAYKDLTYNSLLYLEIILYNENCTPSFLADTLHVARSAVTVKVNELVSKGLVIKTPSKTDKRVSYLKASSEVAEDYKRIDKSLLAAVKEIEETYSQAEIRAFTEMLEIMQKHYMGEYKNEKK
ncbi:MarR family winged helix-turn-helix transcriptional regulator [Priestia filamentosa]|uniref:MarR family winged helix-turn-helix transcriptional regulator n=1 Tax=Priestia filamentosa TaxID=1402861 RepID=UPI002E1EC6CC|nr:MarR family transcriptional regulator [Priestia filamentosa]MED3728381.1 MarR family transcriptional regulator [Priestia filamentosa]